MKGCRVRGISICYQFVDIVDLIFSVRNDYFKATPPPPKKSIFVKKMKIEIYAWEDSPSSALSETL